MLHVIMINLKLSDFHTGMACKSSSFLVKDSNQLYTPFSDFPSLDYEAIDAANDVYSVLLISGWTYILSTLTN